MMHSKKTQLLFLIILGSSFSNCQDPQKKASHKNIFGTYSAIATPLSFNLNSDSSYSAFSISPGISFVDTGKYHLKGDTLHFKSKFKPLPNSDDPNKFNKYLDSLMTLGPNQIVTSPLNNSFFILKGDSLYDPLFRFSLYLNKVK